MVDDKITIQDASEVDTNLLRMLDRGLEDIDSGRTLPHDEAVTEVRRIREAIYDVADIADCIELHLRQYSVQGGN